jgi:hypothetical protein
MVAVRTKLSLCAHEDGAGKHGCAHEDREDLHATRVAFVRTELTWKFGQFGLGCSVGLGVENRGAQKFGRKFTRVAWAARRASAEAATPCGELRGVGGV